MKIQPVEFEDTKLNNWKDYLLHKFPETIFNLKQFDLEDEYVESYKVTLKNNLSKTEIIFQIFKNKIPYVEIHDVKFNNPLSPKLTFENTKNPYGFDGVGSEFNLKNLTNINEYLNIPLKYGWKEKTIFFNEKELKTNAIWKQDGKIFEIPIKQNYLKGYGCLSVPIIPIIIFWNSQKIKLFPNKVKSEINVIEPML